MNLKTTVAWFPSVMLAFFWMYMALVYVVLFPNLSFSVCVTPPCCKLIEMSQDCLLIDITFSTLNMMNYRSNITYTHHFVNIKCHYRSLGLCRVPKTHGKRLKAHGKRVHRRAPTAKTRRRPARRQTRSLPCALKGFTVRFWRHTAKKRRDGATTEKRQGTAGWMASPWAKSDARQTISKR